jgi:protein tyrosine phosphatase
VIHRINTIKISSDEESETPLAIEKVSENRYKDLTPREVNRVQVLRTFIVPPKEEKSRGKIIRHKPIVFYRSELTHDDPQKDGWEEWDYGDNAHNKEEVQIKTS